MMPVGSATYTALWILDFPRRRRLYDAGTASPPQERRVGGRYSAWAGLRVGCARSRRYKSWLYW